MDRAPPVEVRRQLRREVGFGCPVDDCGNPYLYWHHFDPPWREREHHDPEGMIALCAEHHAKADAGAFSVEQLRALKASAASRPVGGRFDWMREQLLAVVGGNFYLEVRVPVMIKDIPVVMFTRDDAGHLLLNLNMLSRLPDPRIQIVENFWVSRGAADDIESPPHGRLLAARYANGDRLRVEFIPDQTTEALCRRYPDAGFDERNFPVELPTPVTVVEIEMTIADTGIEVGPRWTTLQTAQIGPNCFMSHSYAGIAVM